MRYIVCSIFISFLFFCCNKVTEPSDIYREKLYNKELIDSLHDRALHYGDTIAYNQLQAIYYVGDSRTGLLYYALVMSNRYNYKVASYDVYHLLTTSSDNPSDTVMDDKTREMANYYFLRSKSQSY